MKETDNQNIHNPESPVKPRAKKGPFRLRMQAIEAAKVDPHCRAAEAFTLIKHLPTQTYDYAMGANPYLFSGDRIEARYYLLNGRAWSYPDYRGRA